MPGITLIFDNKSNKKLENEYKKINKKFKKEVLSIKKELKPHITLMHFQSSDGDKYNNKIKSTITKLSNKYKSYKIIVNGLAIFVRGNKYILYFTTPYNENLRNIHKNVWTELKKYLSR